MSEFVSAAPRVHDLTPTLMTHMPVWPTLPLPGFEPVGIVSREGYAVARVNCLTHTGTHMDAPYHFLEDGATVDRPYRPVAAPLKIARASGATARGLAFEN